MKTKIFLNFHPISIDSENSKRQPIQSVKIENGDGLDFYLDEAVFIASWNSFFTAVILAF